MESSKKKERGLQLLISRIVERYMIDREEALEVIAKVKEANGGVLKGLKYNKFFKLFCMIIKKKNLDVQREAQAEKKNGKKRVIFVT